MSPHRLTAEPLDAASALAAVGGDDAGAVVTFIGTVRARSRERDVLRLEYEAYEPMALALFERIARACLEASGARVIIHHRLGSCLVGEPTVVIAAAAAHRAQAFDACRHAIEQLKADVPIWKREIYVDGLAWVGQGS
jgi:molybdopterin synthase catalytic subunit